MRKIYRLALGMGVWLWGITPASAATINFEIGFFDDSNRRVGSGTFSYDNESPLTCSEIRNFFTCYTEEQVENLSPEEEEDLVIYGTEIINNPITDFDVDIYGVNWSLLDADTTWWSDEATGQAPGYRAQARTSGRPAYGSWFFGDSFFSTEFLTVDFDRSSDTFGAGTWSQLIQFVDDPPSDLPVEPGEPFSRTSGTWEATIVGATPAPSVPTPEPNPEPDNPASVPEPSNILSTLIAMGLGCFAWRKSSKVKSSQHDC